MERYCFGLRGHDIADSFDDMCIKAQEYGITQIQFAMAKTCQEIDFDRIGYSETLAKKLDEKLKKSNLNISVLGCYINPVHTELPVQQMQLERFENFLHYAKIMGAGGVATETGSIGGLEETRSEENYQTLLKNISKLISVAEDLDVMIYIEPVWQFTIYSVETMKRLIDDINSPKLGVILDISNIVSIENYRNQDSIINSAFDVLGEKIRVIHLKDFCISGNEKKFAKVCCGQLNIKLLFNRISEMNKKPQIILDETPLSDYSAAKERLYFAE